MPALEQVPSLGWPNGFVVQSRPCVTSMLTLASADLSTTAAKEDSQKNLIRFVVKNSQKDHKEIEKLSNYAANKFLKWKRERERGENDVLKTKKWWVPIFHVEMLWRNEFSNVRTVWHGHRAIYFPIIPSGFSETSADRSRIFWLVLFLLLPSRWCTVAI